MRILTNDNSNFEKKILTVFTDVVFVNDGTFDIVMKPTIGNIGSAFISSLIPYTPNKVFQPRFYYVDTYNLMLNLKLSMCSFDEIKTTPFQYFTSCMEYNIFKNMYNDKHFQLLKIDRNITTVIDSGTLEALEYRNSEIFLKPNYTGFIFDDNIKYMVRLYIDSAQVLYHIKLKKDGIFHNYYNAEISVAFKKILENMTDRYSSFEKVVYYVENDKIIIYDIEFGLFPEHLDTYMHINLGGVL